jgi:viroplasmin and RNaseH domain-containing protein
MAKDCYSVFVGRVLGVYDHWPDAQDQVDKYPGASHRGFDNRAEVESSYLRWTLWQERERNRRCLKKYYIVMLLLMLIALLFYIMV